MRGLALWLLVGLGLLFAACKAEVPDAGGCSVTRIVDGDTVHLTCNGARHKVRLLGYDTPEIFHPRCEAERVAGERASDLMRAIAAAGPVTRVRFAGRDRYGRDLADVEIAGQDVAASMLASPLARPYRGHRHPDWCAILAGTMGRLPILPKSSGAP
ncbi:thermonuclease family protein [bacterium]|nr:thermonuclease family protein [bacterium]